MRIFHLFFIIVLAFFVVTGCDNLSSPEDENLELDTVVEEQAAFGYQVNRMVASSSNVAGLTQNSQYYESEDMPDLPTTASLQRQATQLATEARSYFPQIPSLMKTAGDSLIYFKETIIGKTGKRVSVYYDSETGKARITEVIFMFPDWRNMIYDSTDVVIDVNFNLNNPFDDKIESMYKIQNFKEQYFVQSILVKLQVTDYDGLKITGGIVTKDAEYHQRQPLSSLSQYVDINPDGSGTLREDFEFRDGTSSYAAVTFKSDKTGTFAKQRRDGTVISGSFDSAEDDLSGSYQETVDFPEGRFIDKISKSAFVSITLPDSIFNADFSEIVYFTSGRIDSASAAIQVQEADGVKTTKLALTKPNGAYGNLTVEEKENESTLKGNWTTWNAYYIIVEAEYHFDGSAHIHYEVYAPPYNEGDDPIIVADYYVTPDQAGNGTISHNGQSYEIQFSESGQATIAQDGKTKEITLFN